MTRQINDAGISLIKSFESCSLTSYLDVKGIPTIGWGHTAGVTPDSPPITQDDADSILQDDLAIAETAVCRLAQVDLTDNQFAALVSLTYNCGTAPLDGTLGTYLNNGNYGQAADFILRWDHANGVVIEGLTRRRIAERELFLIT